MRQCGSGAKTARVLRTQQVAPESAFSGGCANTGSSAAAAVGPSPPPPSCRPAGLMFTRSSLAKPGGSGEQTAPLLHGGVPLHQNFVSAKTASSQTSNPTPPAPSQNHVLSSTVAKPELACVPTPDEPATVSIKVRNLEGKVLEVKKLFRPSDSLLTVLTEYLHEHPHHQFVCCERFYST